MSSGSDNSNIGYGNLNPYGSNVNPAFVNKWSSNNPANFTSNEIYIGPGGLYCECSSWSRPWNWYIQGF